MYEVWHGVYGIMADGEPRTAREIAGSYYGREPTRYEMRAMARVLHAMVLRGPLDREKTRTVVSVWEYRMEGQRWTPSRR